MKVTTNYQPIYDRVTVAHHGAAEDTLADVKGRQVRRTGRLANSEHLVERTVGGRLRSSITSDVVYADAVERGANARAKASVRSGTKRRKGQSGPVFNRATRRGPHMAGNHIIADTAPRFLGHMAERLRRVA